MPHLQKNQALLAASLDSVIKRPIAFGLIWEGITEGDIDKINRGNRWDFTKIINRPIIFGFISGSLSSLSWLPVCSLGWSRYLLFRTHHHRHYHHQHHHHHHQHHHDYPFVLGVDPDLSPLILARLDRKKNQVQPQVARLSNLLLRTIINQ